MSAAASTAPASGAPVSTSVPINATAGNGTLTCFGNPAPENSILSQIVYYICWFVDLVVGFLESLPLDFNLALALFLTASLFLLLLLCCCCYCCCKKCCCGGDADKKSGKKKRVKQKIEYTYLDPREAPAIKSAKAPKTAFDKVPLIGRFIEEKVQPNLYRIQPNSILKSGLVSGLNDGDADASFNLGRLQFSMKTQGGRRLRGKDLIVGVIQASDLNSSGQSKTGVSSSFISVALLPQNINYETRVVERNDDPTFSEEFTFDNVSKLSSSRLRFRAWHFNRVVVDAPPIGEIVVPLEKYDLGSPVEEWHRFKPPVEKGPGSNHFEFGLICLSLQYSPVQSRLTICVLEASNLPSDPTAKRGEKKEEEDGNKEGEEEEDLWEEVIKTDPMVKATLTLDERKVGKEKTGTKRKTTNPYYNEMLHFTVGPDQIRKVDLTLTVVHAPLVGLPRAIGRVHFGPRAAGRSGQHWMDSLERQGRPVAQWHVLANPKQKRK